MKGDALSCIVCSTRFIAKKKTSRFCSRQCSKLGTNNASWKGADVSIKVLHKWIERRLGRPNCCSKCGTVGNVDLANISQEYKRDLTDWEWLCRKCHMSKDGRLEIFLSHSKKRRLPNRNCEQCGKEFWPYNERGRFCSNPCKVTNYNLNHKDYTKMAKRPKAT